MLCLVPIFRRNSIVPFYFEGIHKIVGFLSVGRINVVDSILEFSVSDFTPDNIRSEPVSEVGG